ncbi:hypothetical protein GCM10010915_21700 [Microbacterium faecale]|uniref:Uncharacterized protein n=1 Tax=Microbacterium faecale TaxID=1804630 RepID=A0A917DI30_9MICO|nr:hypothetical protein GCM10010915_21700 [Microbacterium faecale]
MHRLVGRERRRRRRVGDIRRGGRGGVEGNPHEDKCDRCASTAPAPSTLDDVIFGSEYESHLVTVTHPVRACAAGESECGRIRGFPHVGTCRPGATTVISPAGVLYT